MISLGKIIKSVEDDCGAALISKQDKDTKVGAQVAESRLFRGAEVRLLWECGIGNVDKDVRNVTTTE